MIRLITCVRKKKDMFYRDFRQYGESPAFSELMGKSIDVVKPARPSRNLAFQVGASVKLMESRGSDVPYQTPQAQGMMLDMRAFQAQCLDFASTPSFSYQSLWRAVSL